MAFLPTHPAVMAIRCSVLLLLVALAGCEDGRRSGHGGGSAEMGGTPPPPMPDMAASGTFFAGQIEVDVLLGSNGFTRPSGDDKSDPSDSAGGGRRGGAGNYGGGGGGRKGRGGSGGSDGSAARSSDGDDPTPHIPTSNAPPVRLHLRLTNHGTAPAEVEVVDFNSDLGNFVVEPSRIAVAPNASAEADPMISRLGVNADAIPVTVNLRLAGHSEKQVLTLRAVTPPTPPPSAPASPATPTR
jgi:hypothetical protein